MMGIEIPQALIDEIAAGRATLFLGAGASREAGFPDSTMIAAFLAEKAGGKLAQDLKGQTLDVVADFLYSEPGYGPQWVRQKIIEFFESFHKSAKRPPSKAHELMTKIRWSIIFTTNYDRLVEISYDSSPECVQRFLPIYSSDLQTMKREEDVVRIIKLNGSVDEAARNSSHNLVVTFSDQTNATRLNSLFYMRLQEEAINGPVIFVGFSFIHPGAYEKGSSPEFLLLENILREVGPMARWHYCVAPFDQSRFETKLITRKLEANRITVINATFGDFMGTLFSRLKSPPLPLEKRSPVVIQIGSANALIQADDYAKDKMHFELVGSHLTTDPAPSVSKSLNGFENWSSFFSRHFIERACKQEFLRKVQKSLDDAPFILAFVASPGWGKTFFLRDFSVQSCLEGRPVIWLNPYSTIELRGQAKDPLVVGTWDAMRIDTIVQMINDKSRETKISERDTIPIIVADNCSERTEEAISLFRYLKGNNRAFALIITFRSNEFDLLTQQNPLLRSCKIFKPEGRYSSQDEVRTLVDFCAQNNVGSIESVSQKEVVAQRIIESEADVALIFALQIIFDKQHRPFAEIVKGIWDSLENEHSKEIMLRVASLHRFGSTFYPRLYSLLNTFPFDAQIQALAAYRNCIAKGILFEEVESGEPCVRTLHSLVAEKIAEVSGATKARLDEKLLLISKKMTNNNNRDLELIRHLLKQINDYTVSLSSEEKVDILFQNAVESTNDDWVICQQFSKYLLRRNDFETAFAWTNRALEKNPNNAALHHQKGNILRRWGMSLKEEQKAEDANRKFQEARRCFTLSRMGPMPTEYGFVTHLDMLLYLMNNSENETEKANLIAEGAQLYSQGVRTIPQYAYSFLLDPRFRIFDVKGTAVNELCEKIERAVKQGASTPYGVAFLSDNLYKKGQYAGAVELLQEERKRLDDSVLLWVKEAELHAREGHFAEAAKCLSSARMREKNAENAEVQWRLAYWNLITSFILEDFKEARIAAGRLSNVNVLPRQRLPQGYLWKEEARNVPCVNWRFREDAKIWSGRVESLQIGGQYGRIELTNVLGDSFNVDFNPKYFVRRNLRIGEYVRFVIAIYPFGLRAVSEDSKIFANTTDDVFVRT